MRTRISILLGAIIAVTFFLPSIARAQDIAELKMRVELNDGTEVKLGANDLGEITARVETPVGVSKYKQRQDEAGLIVIVTRKSDPNAVIDATLIGVDALKQTVDQVVDPVVREELRMAITESPLCQTRELVCDQYVSGCCGNDVCERGETAESCLADCRERLAPFQERLAP